MQPLPVLPQTPAKLSQPPAQLVHLGSADVGGLQVERAPQRLADLGGLHAVVVKVEQQVADARLLAQSAGDDIEGRGLLRHEHDGPPLRQGTEDQVRHGLRLARPRRPLDHEAAPGRGVGHHPRLIGVGDQRQVLNNLVKIVHRAGRIDRIRERRRGGARGLQEVTDQRVGGDGRPVLLQVLPHAVGGETEQPQVHGALDNITTARPAQPTTHPLQGGLDIDAVLVAHRLAQLDQINAGIRLETCQ